MAKNRLNFSRKKRKEFHFSLACARFYPSKDSFSSIFGKAEKATSYHLMHFHFKPRILNLFRDLTTIIMFPFRSKKVLVLVGENGGRSAQDNGFIFFQYCQEMHPDLPVYFVIRRKSKDIQRVSGMSNILYYWSLRHILYFLLSTHLVRTHDLNDHMRGGKLWQHIFIRKKKVFLQHGIIAFKDVSYIYSAKVYHADAFIVSSDLEKKIIHENFGFKLEQIFNTGMPRYDLLNPDEKAKENKILFMPTWRGRKGESAAKFLKTSYAKHIQGLLNNTSLHEWLDQVDCDIDVYLHINMQPYAHLLQTTSSRVRIRFQGQENVQTLLRRASFLITDYSSVSWDFFYLGKPVLFYRFDLEEYEKEQGSFVNLREELFGEVVYQESDVIEKVKFYHKRRWELPDHFKKRLPELFSHRDRQNCARIFEVLSYLSRR